MKATLTKTYPVSNRQAKPGRNLVYVKSPFDNIADEFGTEVGIWNLPFKSKTWSKVCRKLTSSTFKPLRISFRRPLLLSSAQRLDVLVAALQDLL